MLQDRLRDACVLALFFSAGSVANADWPSWRGPSGDGVASVGEYPTELSLEGNLAWKAKLPGPGASTPIIQGDRIYVTSEADGRNSVCCYSLAGEKLWQQTFGQVSEAKHRVATGANPSAVATSSHLAVYFKSGELVCLDISDGAKPGVKVWEVNLQDRFGADTLWWDLGSSPVLTGTNDVASVVVPIMQDDLGLLVCYDLATGTERWKTERKFETDRESGQAYTTPVLTTVDGRQQLVTFGADHLTGHDAITGESLWTLSGFNPQKKGMWRTIASPVVADGVVLTCFGRGDFLKAHRFDAEGVLSDADELWSLDNVGADVPTPAVQAGKAYVLNDRGSITCVAVKTGKIEWTAKLPRSRARYFASPTVAEDLMFMAREDGAIFTARIAAPEAAGKTQQQAASEPFAVIAELNLEETTVATPVLTDGRVLIRTHEWLYCFSAK